MSSFGLKLLGWALVVAAGGILVVRPFLDGVARDYALGGAFVLLALFVGLAILRQRVTTGRWLRDVPPEELADVRKRAKSDQNLSLVYLAAMTAVGMPAAFFLKHLGWSKNETLLVCFALAIPAAIAAHFGLRRWNRPPA